MGFLDKKKKEILNSFVKFVIKELEIKKPPTVSIQNGRGKLRTTASYDYSKENKIIKINGKNRILVDILRSVAHELKHHQQFEDGKLKVKPPDIGGEIEDGANIFAGNAIKMFAKTNRTIYDE